MSGIKAQIVADSIDPRGNRLTSMLITFPRFILAELNTHRMLSKNSASSRAIPFNKMVESVQNNPFIPIAWQKDHKGMQGSEYLTGLDKDQCEFKWVSARNRAVGQAIKLNEIGVTKQLANRLLEPFMMHTVLISGTEWENFFSLRCPQYYFNSDGPFRSRKDLLKKYTDSNMDTATDIEWLTCNKGQAEIHMMELSEKMYDAMQESVPKILKEGEWHLPMIEVIED